MNRLILIMITFLICLTSGCIYSDNKSKTNTESINEQYKKLSPERAKEDIEKDKNIVILDVRTINEYNEGHLPDSLLIPDYELESKAAELLPDKNVKIYIYCRSGVRSKNSAKLLISLGYTNVYDIGGIKTDLMK